MQKNGHDSSHRSSANDELLCFAVRDAISRSEPIRASMLHTVNVQAENGKVTLTGLAGSEAQRAVAEHLAKQVRGVESVENLLVCREDLERTIGAALAGNEATRHLRLMVRAAGLVPILYGVVATTAEAEAAIAVAKKALHGLEVRSALHVVPKGEPILLLEQHSVEGRQLAGRLAQPEVGQVESVETQEAPRTGDPPAAPAEGMA